MTTHPQPLAQPSVLRHPASRCDIHSHPDCRPFLILIVAPQGHNARGWRNWRLLSIDEAAGADQEAPEVVHADDPETRARHLRSLLGPHRYRLPDGTLLTGTELAAEIIRLEAQPDGVKWSVEMPPGGVQIDSSILRATLEPRRSVAEPSLPLPFDNGAGGLDHFPK